MGQELVIVPAGLYTDPSPHGAAPPGALRTATNVVLRRAGSVEPRPGFVQSRQRPSVNLAQVQAILGYPGTDAVLYVGTPQTTHTTYMHSDGTGTAVAVTMDSGGALPWMRGHMQAAAIRKNLYLTTSDNLRKITGGTDTTASKVGTPPCELLLVAPNAPGTAVPASKAVSYRAVVLRKDANGLEVRSAPSNRVIFRNTSAGPVDPKFNIYVHQNDDNDGANILIELYRSLAVDVDESPFDEHFFAKTLFDDNNDYILGGVTRVDDVLEVDLGAALYTNEDEEGAAHANLRPPQAKDVHEFNGSLFLANLTYPAQVLLRFPYKASLLASDALGIGERVLTGTYTNGSAVVTGVASTAGFRVGQIVRNDLAEWADTVNFIRITAITAATVTLSSTYTGATGPKDRVVYDSIRVGAQYFPVSESWLESVSTFWVANVGGFGNHLASSDVYALTEDARTVTYSPFIAVDPINRTLLLKAINPTTSPFLVYATHGSEYVPPLPEPTAAGKVADQDVFPSGVAWSKTFEPEHFSLVDMELIGSDRADTWRIKKGRDALWILKTEGIWRLSGAGRDSGFRIDPVSKAKLVTPNCVADVFDQVYAWTDQGILALDSGANEVQSHAVRDQLITLQGIAGRFIGLFGTWLCSNQKAHEIIVCVQHPQVETNNYLLVYNFLTNAWTRWNLPRIPSCGGSPLGALEFGIDAPVLEGGQTYVTMLEGLSLQDFTYSATVNVVSGFAVTIAAGSGWVPVAGDTIEAFLVDTVTDATHFTVNRLGLTAGLNKTALVAYPCEIEPVACTTKNPSILKLWQDGSVLWGDLRYIASYTLSFTSSLNQVPVTTPKVLTTAGQPGCSHRFIVPRAHARTEQLFVKVTVRNAGEVFATDIWRWQGLSLFSSAMGPRVRSR